MDIAGQAKTTHGAGQRVEVYPFFAEGGCKAACDRAGEREEAWNPASPPTRIKGLTIAQWACIVAGVLAFFVAPLLLHPEMIR
jgi:hypothetical protein